MKETHDIQLAGVNLTVMGRRTPSDEPNPRYNTGSYFTVTDIIYNKESVYSIMNNIHKVEVTTNEELFYEGKKIPVEFVSLTDIDVIDTIENMLMDK